jgi:GDP-D-mannose 3', 5'-epimerase
MFIDDCVEGSIKIMISDIAEPLNLGTDEMIDMNSLAKMTMGIAGKDLPIKNIPGPEGVRGRNSDNTMIKAKLGWAPSISIKDGFKVTHAWIQSQIDKEAAAGKTGNYGTSEVVKQVTDTLDTIGK